MAIQAIQENPGYLENPESRDTAEKQANQGTWENQVNLGCLDDKFIDVTFESTVDVTPLFIYNFIHHK